MRATQLRQHRPSTPAGHPSAFPSSQAPGSGEVSGQGKAGRQRPALIEAGAAASLSQERRDLICSVIGLTVKCGLVLMAGVSLVRLAGAYQERMDRQGELAAVLELEQGKVAKARERFDSLFTVDGEQRLIREQNQWIAPNRLRVVWKQLPAGGGPASGGGSTVLATTVPAGAR